MLAPDTLDLAERAELAINGIIDTIDPDLHYMMFFHVYYHYKTPWMRHHCADVTCDPKYAESLPMMRIICGSKRYADIEAGQRTELVSRIRNGLYWNFADPARPWRTSYNPVFDGIPKDEDLANVGANGRMLRTLLTWKEVDGNKSWDKTIRELVRGLARIAVKHEDYSYYPNGGFDEPLASA